MVTYCYLWVSLSVVICVLPMVYRWLLMVIDGYLWLLMVIDGYLWLLMVIDGWLPMVILFDMVIYGY